MKKLLVVVCLVCAANLTKADIIADWTFETSPLAAPVTGATQTYGPADAGAQTGGSSASGVHASALTSWSSPVGNGSVHSFSANTWAVNDYWQFQVSTLGYTSIALQWQQ